MPGSLVGLWDGDYSGSGKIWASLIIAHCLYCHSVTKKKWGGRDDLVTGAVRQAMQVLEFRQQKKELQASVDMLLVPVPPCGAPLSAPAAQPLAKLEGPVVS